MIKLFYRFWAVLQLAIERLLHHPGLTFLALLGIVLAIGLVSNAAFFAQAVDQVILNQELEAFSKMTGRPPFSTSVYTFPSARSPISMQMAEELAQNVSATLSDEVGLPVEHLGMQVHSGNMMLQPKAGDTQYGAGEFLGSVNVVYVQDVSDKMEIIAGEELDPDRTSEEILDVWMHTRLAEKMGVNVGEELSIGVNVQTAGCTIRVAGIWQAADIEDDFWFENPDATLQNTLLVRRQDYVTYIQPLVAAKSWYVSWHIILDGDHVYPELAQEYLQGFTRAETIINKYLPNARINTPPLDPLDSFVTRGDTLTVILLSFNIPAFGFLLYFLTLSSIIIAQWQQRETAMLVGRGMRSTSILTLTFVEEILLFIIGYPLGIGLGMVLAHVMGNTASFLSFTTRPPLPVALRGLNVPVTIVALIVALLSRIIPAYQATRLSAIEVDRAMARPSKGPLWYRAFLDFLLLIPTYYAYRQVSREGSLSMLVQDSPADLYQDPLLILVPALFILTAALMSLRLFPFVMKVLDFFANLIPWTSPHLALRELARRSHTYINPLLLVIVSLGLGVYTLSMADSMDQWLIDRIYYAVGSDISFSVLPLNEDTSQEPITAITGEWIPQPANFKKIPGVAEATRVGNYPMNIMLMNGVDVSGRFMAIDRTDFDKVSWFRTDFSPEPLGGLMNKLALASNAILVSEEVFNEGQLLIGDEINLRININYELQVVDNFVVAGTFKYFPTVYEPEDVTKRPRRYAYGSVPEEQITFIGNLDHLNFYVGMTVPHGIWLHTEPGADANEILESVPTMLRVLPGKEGDAVGMINEEQAKFERVGVFGTLSVGFLAAVVMAVMGLLIYTYASLRERLHRFTILRAVGLLQQQIAAQVVMEYAFLTAYGSVAGALIGSFASSLFVPLFRFSGEAGRVPLPPLIPVIAEDQVRVLILVFVGIIIALEVFVITRALSKRAFSLLKSAFG